MGISGKDDINTGWGGKNKLLRVAAIGGFAPLRQVHMARS